MYFIHFKVVKILWVHHPQTFKFLQHLPSLYVRSKIANTWGTHSNLFHTIYLQNITTTTCDIGVVPIIRCPRGNAAEAVAVALDKKLRENLRDTRNSMFTGDNIPVAQLR